MRYTSTVILLALTGLCVPVSAFAADTVGKVAQVTTTDRTDFAAGGIIHIKGSYGLLNIEGWDKPEVEVTVTRSRPLHFGESRAPDQDQRRLDSIQITTNRTSATELTISTKLASRHGDWAPPLPAGTTNDVNADYEIHIPRDSRLTIQHGAGLVQVRGVTGDIDASVRRGDLLIWVPPGAYSIDARTRFGIVSSELDGAARNHYLIGEHFTRASPAPSRKLTLRAGFGITIRQIPPE